MTSLAWVAAVISIRGLLSLLALGLQLSWQAQQQRERRHYLLTVTRALPTGAQIDEGQPDGSWLRLTIGCPQASESHHG